MLRYSISILLVLLTGFCTFAQEPVVEEEEPEEKRPVIIDSAHQLRLGFDVSRLYFNNVQKQLEKKTGYEIELDYYWRKDVYLEAEGGFGSSSLNYPDLAYESDNIFFRLGINKSLLPRLKQNDWDMAFIGLRYGLGFINRSAASYTITDDLFGSITNTAPADKLTAHWIEITGGVRVEIVRCVFVGWNIRGKFMLNSKQFKELPPYYIAGYGKGEKSSVFDFNVFVSYALRWDKKRVDNTTNPE